METRVTSAHGDIAVYRDLEVLRDYHYLQLQDTKVHREYLGPEGIRDNRVPGGIRDSRVNRVQVSKDHRVSKDHKETQAHWDLRAQEDTRVDGSMTL